ncbi:MAG: 50S ribosomal protein L6 [Anaerolineae bacterium]|nr:MAG: 50S ribosomal protein L6 [Anaerolineae bacterium]
MSRVGRLPIEIPNGVDVTIKGSYVKVKGPKGELEHVFPASVKFHLDGNTLTVERVSDERTVRAMHGTARALINNMVVGVSQGFQKVLEVNGVGYRAEMNGKNLVLHVGYSHPVEVEPPAGIEFDVEARSRQIFVKGYDKQQVGQVAANIRKVRPPEPYKGKGIKYLDEVIRRKAGKSGK